MPRGGSRPGAGRKPKRAVVVGMDGRRREGTTPAPDPTLATAPADLPRAQRAIWTAYAPHAIAQGTLVAATAGGFRELCSQWVFVDELAKKIQKLGPGTVDAERYIRSYTKLAQRLDASLARFKLTAFGKAEAGAGRKTPAANPWAGLAK